jgi:dihydroflavonol-4-reductase
MRAFVTGGTGFIGFHVIRALLQRGDEVRALVRPGSSRNRHHLSDIRTVAGDLRSADGLIEAMRGCDAVFHVGAHYSLYRRDAATMYEVNVRGTERVLVAARAADVGRVVFTSSTATVGLRADGWAADETSYAELKTAVGAYKRSKILSERIALAAAQEGQDVVIVNPSTPIGSGDVKPTPTGRIVLDTLTGRMPAYVDSGLNIVAVSDVAAGHVLAYERGVAGERYILGNQNMTLRQLLEVVAECAGIEAPRVRLPLWCAVLLAVFDEGVLTPITGRAPRAPLAGALLARHPMYFRSDKAVRELGLPQTPVAGAIAEAVAWFLQSAGRSGGKDLSA